MERSRVESLTKELFIIREELKTTSQNLIQKEKKLVDLEMSATANQQSALKTSELLTKTTEECKLLQYQLQEKNHQLEQLRHDHKEYEAKYSGVLKDLQTLQSEYEYCKSLMGNMQETYRENERFSHQIQQLKSEYDLLASQDNSKEKQLHLLTMELEKKEKTLSDLTTEKKEIAGRYEKLIYDLQAKENDLRVERDQHLQLESALAEQRNITSTLQKELDSLRNLTQKDDLRWNQNENLLKNQRNEMERVCGLFFQAVVKWDQILSGTLEVFEASNSSQHGSHGASTAGYDGKSFLRNGGYPSHGFLYSSSLPPSPETSEDLLPSSLILIERVQGKLERVDKIRSLFEKKTKELLSSMTIRVSHSDDRIEILSHKTSALQLQLQTVITQILHEKKIRDQSYQDLKTLQESVLKGHHDQLREHEARATELHLLYQTEKNKVSTLNHEISVLSEEVKIQQEELSKLHEAEEMLHQLSNQLTSITEANRLLSHESEEKSQRINDQCEDILRFKQENESHRANLAKLTSQIEVRDKMLTEQESLISSLKVEMQRLQQRQIHPELEKSIKESQDILKYSLGRLGSDQIQQAQPQPVPSLSSSSQVSKLVNENFVHLVDRLASLCQLTSQLVDETTHAWKSFDERYQLELGVRGHLSLSKPTSVSTEIEQSIYDLLNSNAKLSLQLQGVVNDFKRYVNDQETFSSRASEEPSILSTLQTTPAPLRSSQYPSTPLFSAIKDQSKLLASDLRIESYPASPLSHSLPFAARKEMSLPQTSSQTEHIRVQFQLPDTQHRQFRNHESTTPSSTSNQHGDRWGESTSRVSARSGVHRTDSVDDGWGTRSKLLFETREDDHYPSHYPSTPPSQIHQPKSTHSSSRRTVHLFGTESSSSISTPARQSTSRLTKLGQDLQNLANRLDQFDAKSRK